MRRNKLLIVLTVLLILAALSLHDKEIQISGKTATQISGTFEAQDEAPRLIQLIPNQTLSPNQNVTLNLSTYFKEPNAEDLTFSFTSMTHFIVSLDNTTNIVNMTVKRNWKGRETIIFTAYDTSNNNVSSNNITILIRSITIHYSNYSGATTNLDNYSDEELENITDMTIENVSSGKIIFAETINISENIDLDEHINISDNHIEINSTALPNFNKPAMLWLYNLTFTDPRILKDGEICSATICTEINYSTETGILIFNVTGFSAYSAEETPGIAAPPPSEEPADAGGTGVKGATGFVPEKPEFEVDISELKIDVKQNRVKRETIKISNPTDNEIEVEIGLTEEHDFIHSEDKITLAPGETKDIELVIAPTEENKPDAYTSRIVLKKDKYLEYIPLVINVQQLLELIDVEMEIYSDNAEVAPKENLLAGIKIYNLGESESIDVKIEWYVKDFSNNVLVRETSATEVETQIAFVKKIFIPSNVEPGEYVLVAIAAHDDSSIVASSMFRVVQRPILEMPVSADKGMVLLLIIVAFAILFLIIVLIAVIIHERRTINDLLKKEDYILRTIAEKKGNYDEAIAEITGEKKKSIIKGIFRRIGRYGRKTKEGIVEEKESIAKTVKKEANALKNILKRIIKYERGVKESLVKKERAIARFVKKEANALKNILEKLVEYEKKARHGLTEKEDRVIRLAGKEVYALKNVLKKIRDYEKRAVKGLIKEEKYVVKLVKKEGSMLKDILKRLKRKPPKKILPMPVKVEHPLPPKEEGHVLDSISKKLKKYEKKVKYGFVKKEDQVIRLARREAHALKEILEKLREYERRRSEESSEKKETLAKEIQKKLKIKPKIKTPEEPAEKEPVIKDILRKLRKYEKRTKKGFLEKEEHVIKLVKKEAHALKNVLKKLKEYEGIATCELLRKEAYALKFVREEASVLKNVLRKLKQHEERAIEGLLRKEKYAVKLVKKEAHTLKSALEKLKTRQREQGEIQPEKAMEEARVEHTLKPAKEEEPLLKNILKKLREYEKKAKHELAEKEELVIKLAKKEVSVLKKVLEKLREYEKKTLGELLKKHEFMLKSVLKRLKEYENKAKHKLLEEEELAIELAREEGNALKDILERLREYESKVKDSLEEKEELAIKLLEKEGSALRNTLKNLREYEKKGVAGLIKKKESLKDNIMERIRRR